MNFKIGKHTLGTGKKTFIVAELSGNHNGSIERAKKLIKYAKLAGADAVKLQTYKADTITLKSDRKDFKIGKNSPWHKYKNYWNLYNNASTPWSWHKELFDTAKKYKIEIFSSPFDESAVDFLEKLGCPAYKIASPEINHIPLIEKAAKTKKPIILSTGLAQINEIKQAIKVIKKNKNQKIIILKCTSAYPAPIKELNLKTIENIKKRFKVLSGISDHSRENTAALVSVALGGALIEKHFNLSDKTKTVDSFFSSNMENFTKMVKSIREVEDSLGTINYKISESSKKNLVGRRSIYVSVDIKKGEIISSKNVKIIRPCYGLNPKYYNKILGKVCKKNLKAGDRFKLNYVDNVFF